MQPTGAHNAYPVEWTVTRDDKTWESLIPNNVTMPGDPADPQNYRWWKNLSAPPAPGVWSGEGVAYAVDTQALYEPNGKTYKCLQAHTSQPGWTPVAVPALWQEVTA